MKSIQGFKKSGIEASHGRIALLELTSTVEDTLNQAIGIDIIRLSRKIEDRKSVV